MKGVRKGGKEERGRREEGRRREDGGRKDRWRREERGRREETVEAKMLHMNTPVGCTYDTSIT